MAEECVASVDGEVGASRAGGRIPSMVAVV